MPGPAPTLPPGMTGSDVNDRAPTYAGSLDAAETEMPTRHTTVVSTSTISPFAKTITAVPALCRGLLWSSRRVFLDI